MPSTGEISWFVHSATVLAPIAYILALLSYFDWIRVPVTSLFGRVRVEREERLVAQDGSNAIILNVLWPGWGFSLLGDQVLAILLAVFHLFFVAQLLLEQSVWKVAPLLMIFVNLVVGLGRLFKVLDEARTTGRIVGLRFRRAV